MLLAPEDAALFFKLQRAFMWFVNARREVVPEIETPDEYSALPPETRIKVHEAFLAEPGLIEQFVEENPCNLTDEELGVVSSWRHCVAGNFFIFRYLKKHAVFLAGDPPVAYGVVALTDPFEALAGPYLPVWVKTVLLPFKDKIVYDGLMMRRNISFGAGIRRNLNEDYKAAKERLGIVTSLPIEAQPAAAKTPPKKATRKKPAKAGSHEVRAVLETIVAMTDGFCREFLNDEYADLCRKLAEKLARKRPSPLLSGRPNTWAGGIVRTIGWVNFLDDRTTTPHMKLPMIDEAFGVSQSTGQGKSKAIRSMLRIRQFDHEWTLPSRMEDNPMVWMVEVNGFLMDVRDAPREVQEIAFEKGLIPYIPADRG